MKHLRAPTHLGQNLHALCEAYAPCITVWPKTPFKRPLTGLGGTRKDIQLFKTFPAPPLELKSIEIPLNGKFLTISWE